MTKLATYAPTAQTRDNGTTIFWRTGRGSHRHASAYCANGKRSIHTGDVFVIPEAEAADWAPCADCCTDADLTQAAAQADAKRDAMCRNSGVTHPQRIQSHCTDCGKLGTVNRNTGTLRAHKPQPAAAPAAPAAAAPTGYGSMNWTLGELRGFAKERSIPGRSKMTGPELLAALGLA